MVFSSLTFLCLFLPCTLLGYYLIRPQFKNGFLLLASLFFYAWGEPYFVLIMLGSICANYLFALWVSEASSFERKKIALVSMVLFNLAIFFVFKYMGWFLINLNRILPLEIPVPDIALPIGISFFTFQAMSYVFDVYYGKARVQKNVFNVALYIALFPQLIAGPIVRYRSIAAQLVSRQETMQNFAAGACRFTVGLAKKVIIANSLGSIADTAFGSPCQELSMLHAWIGALAYTFQIFFDFSGYSDMAIGLGKMFGFHFEENFKAPYTSRSITEFWRRWHISLGAWFRDYVYIPLGGSRGVSNQVMIRNLGIVWFLTGLWHGASWNFIFWGLYYYLLICMEKFCLFRSIGYQRLPAVCRWAGTFLLILFGWVLFRASGLPHGIGYYAAMFGLTGNSAALPADFFILTDNAVFFLLASLACTPIVPQIRTWLGHRFQKLPVADMVSFIGHGILLIVSLAMLAVDGYNPFIYFNF